MASYIGSTLTSNNRTHSGTSPRVCPDCGGLECLCRPRFFAGQLLTEQEFNRLDRYIVEKNKLHNRYLHGWGVVCGLDVECDGCGGGVLVKSGYALSPCGEDIVVCEDAPVDVCSLINQCKKKATSDCGAANTSDGCAEAIQEWVLGICYTETASRGVMPLRNGGTHVKPTNGGCGCGGGHTRTSGAKSNTRSGCGCGCGQGTKAASGTNATTTSALQCESTVLCEGYRFCVYPAPNTKQLLRAETNQVAQGDMPARFKACLQNLTDSIPELPTNGSSNQAWHDWVYSVKMALQAYVRDNPTYDCQLQQKIGAIVCPATSLSGPGFKEALATARDQLLLIVLELMLACMCRALQPPCPDPVTDDCVPLAVITVKNSETCKVDKICNWTTLRKYATTFPNLQYWLSFLPLGRLLREALENFCCKAVDQFIPEQQGGGTYTHGGHEMYVESSVKEKAKTSESKQHFGEVPLNGGSPATAFRASAQTITRSKAFLQMALDTIASSGTSMDAETLTLGLLGETNVKNERYLTTQQSENVMQFLVMDQMLKPMMRMTTPNTFANFSSFSGMANLFGMANATKSTTSTEQDFEARLQGLSDTVKKQQKLIDDLTVQLKPKGSPKKSPTPKKKNG